MADWRKDLEKAYQKGAKWAVKDSNKTYDKTISDTGRDALTRGLGRSSYTTQTLANLQTDKNEAGNRIRSEFELEYLKELQQRELEEEKLAEQKRQFDLQMAASAGGGGGGGYYPRPDKNPLPGDINNPKNYSDWLNENARGVNNPLRGAAVGIMSRRGIANNRNTGGRDSISR